MSIFSEDSKFSFRKLWALVCLVLFATSVIGYLVANGFGEIPSAYWGGIYIVILFYFARDALKGLKITK